MKPYFKKSHNAWYVNRGKRQIRLGKSEEEAMAKMADYSDDIRGLVRLFLDHYKNEGTRNFYRDNLKPFLSLGLTSAARLKPHHLTRLLNGYEGNYKHNIAKAVKVCFNWLKEQGHIDASPFVSVKTPPEIYRGDEAYVCDAREKIELASADLRDILTIMLCTGCRPQEARAIEAKHYQNRAVIFAKKDSKGNVVQRVVRLPKFGQDILERQIEKYHSGPVLRCGNKPWTKQDLCKACKPLGFTAYHLRHTFATNAAIKDINIAKIADLMGHSGLKTLMKIYQHVNRCSDDLQEAVERINA
jgi:integrase